MSWNYRVLKARQRKTFPNGHKVDATTFTIREVHYDRDGRIRAYSKEPDAPSAGTLDELREVLVMMLNATYRMAPLRFEYERKHKWKFGKAPK